MSNPHFAPYPPDPVTAIPDAASVDSFISARGLAGVNMEPAGWPGDGSAPGPQIAPPLIGVADTVAQGLLSIAPGVLSRDGVMIVSETTMRGWLPPQVSGLDVLGHVATTMANALASKGWEVRILDREISKKDLQSLAPPIDFGIDDAWGKPMRLQKWADLIWWDRYRSKAFKWDKHPNEPLMIVGAPGQMQVALSKFYACKTTDSLQQERVILVLGLFLGLITQQFRTGPYDWPGWLVFALVLSLTGLVLLVIAAARIFKRTSYQTAYGWNVWPVEPVLTMSPRAAFIVNRCWPVVRPSRW
jgi:hypothetical protein